MIGEKEYWNQGYGTETMIRMFKYGFEELNLNRIFLRVFEGNERGNKPTAKRVLSMKALCVRLNITAGVIGTWTS